MNRILLIVIALMTFGIATNAQVVVNEYSASNLNTFTDSFGKTEDWIELYNTSTEAMDLSGFHLSDKITKTQKWPIPEGTVIDGNGYLLFYCSGRDSVVNGSEYHTNFKLAQTKGTDRVIFADSEGVVIDDQELLLTMVEQSRLRAEDGSDDWKIARNPTPGSTNNNVTKYDGLTATPTMSLEAGFYQGMQMVEITNNEPNSVLRYTTNGDNPTPISSEYNSPINVTETTVIKAQAFSNNPDMLTGKMDFNTYFIDEDFSLVVFSVAADDVIDLANGNGGLIPIGSLEYFDSTKERVATSYGSLNRHGQDSWVLNHRSIDWVSRDEMGYSKSVDAPLFNGQERDEFQKFMFRNSGDDNYPAINDGVHDGSAHIRDEYVQTLASEGGMELDYRDNERVVVFLNGEYWGVYGMRDRPVDHDYTDEKYDQGKYDLQYLTTWGGTEIQYGGQQAALDWGEIRDFALNNDLSIAENYKTVDDAINLISMTDYMLANLNAVASDWLNYNTGWWRGLNPEGKHKKWGYILWDLDATFDYYINYSGVPNTDPDAVPCDLEDIAEFMDNWWWWDGEDTGQHEKIFLKLLDESPEFQQLYYGRSADLMNTVYSCENMIYKLDSMLAIIEPEMPRQIDRWGGSMTEWEENIDDLKDFINERCGLVDDGILECYTELNGPYEVTLLTQPDGIGEIDFNTLDIESFPWSGNYFGGMENKIKAKVFDEFELTHSFSHWESKSGNLITPSVTDRKAMIELTEGDTLIAVFKLGTSISDLPGNIDARVFPNPTRELITLEYDLEESSEVKISLYNTMGSKIRDFSPTVTEQSAGTYYETLNLSNENVNSGFYILKLEAGNKQKTFKISVIN